jgi:tryptophan synthase beta chain
MELAGERPDVVIGCVGGGSNYAGIAYPFMADKLSGATPDMRFVACEPAACPTLTKGRFAYDFGDTAGMTPLLPMYTLARHVAPVHAEPGPRRRLRPLSSARPQEAPRTRRTDFRGAVLFAKTQGIIRA